MGDVRASQRSAWNAYKKPYKCALETDWPGVTFTHIESGPAYPGICSEEPQEDSSTADRTWFCLLRVACILNRVS